MTYDNNLTIEDSINKDTDGDGIPDWEEPLYGLDPTKKETTPGIPDSTALSKLQVGQEPNTVGTNESVSPTEPEKLTQTEQFSRELFATVAASSQNGTMDQPTIDALGASLAEKIESPVVRKVFTTSDLKTTNDDSKLTVIGYIGALSKVEAKYPVEKTVTKVLEILQKFIADENNLDISALTELDPIIEQIQSGMNEGLKISVPQSLAQLHLDSLNALERVKENLSDIRLFDTDPIVTMGAINQYYQNATSLESIVEKLQSAVTQKLLGN